MFRKVCTTCINEGLSDIVPVHIPVPVTSSENYWLSEFFIALFSFACGFVQYFNIYQNAWWLPHSYHHYGLVKFISKSMYIHLLSRVQGFKMLQNLHLIDWFIVQFIVVMTLRPFIFSIVRIYVMKLVSKFESNRNLSPCIRYRCVSLFFTFPFLLILFRFERMFAGWFSVLFLPDMEFTVACIFGGYTDL